jgi:hypothetical protein
MTAHAKSRQMAVALGMVWLLLFSSFCLCMLHCHNHDHTHNHDSIQVGKHSSEAIAKSALECNALKHCGSKFPLCMQECKTLETSVLPKTIKLSQNSGTSIINATEQYFSHSIFGLLKEIVRPPPQALPPCKLICLLRSMRC